MPAQNKGSSKVALYGIDEHRNAHIRGCAMRILSKKDLRALVLYSPAHIDRLEKAGRFPKRVQLGPCRVGWIETEVLGWLEERIRERDGKAGSGIAGAT